MNISHSSSCIIIIISILTILLSESHTSHSHPTSKEYSICSETFNCGNITNITYPFYGLNRPSYCGHPGFQLLNCNQTNPQLIMKSQTFTMMAINYTSSTVKIARQDFKANSGCPNSLNNITIDFSMFEYTSSDTNLTLFFGNCSSLCNSTTFKSFPCPMSPRDVQFCWLTNKAMLKNNISEFSCPNRMFLPIYKSDDLFLDAIGAYNPSVAWDGFELQWRADNAECNQCIRSGGQCGHDPLSNKFFCFCTDESKCPFPGSSSCKAALSKTKIALIALFSAIGVCILIAIALYLKCSSSKEESHHKRKPDVEAFLRNQGTFGLQRYTYSDLKKITRSFSNKLGGGGYGTVYKGKLQDTGHFVAVKILKKSEGDAEEFMNEVASIGKTNHVNIVTLLGFCYEDRHRALVYDYMPNGSLKKYLYGRNNNERLLSWEELFQIAVGIARGLEYLHRGCNTRILHFDIKPHNILLDENFCPKISDFGLAKLCPQKESLVSISEARGTIGYIAPEVFLRSFGGVSYKSDVYSYGMLVLEMVGCRRKADIKGDERASEKYFPQWIYEQLEVAESLEYNEQEMLSFEEKEIQKKMILVSLSCVKTNPSSRPEMSRVVDMLERSVESLQIPRISSLAPSSSVIGSSSETGSLSSHHTSSHSFNVTSSYTL